MRLRPEFPFLIPLGDAGAGGCGPTLRTCDGPAKGAVTSHAEAPPKEGFQPAIAETAPLYSPVRHRGRMRASGIMQKWE